MKRNFIIVFLIALIFSLIGIFIGYKNYDYFSRNIIINEYEENFLYDSVIKTKTRYNKSSESLAYIVSITNETNDAIFKRDKKEKAEYCLEEDIVNIYNEDITLFFDDAVFIFNFRDKDGFKISEIRHDLRQKGWTNSLCDKLLAYNENAEPVRFIAKYTFEGEFPTNKTDFDNFDSMKISFIRNK